MPAFFWKKNVFFLVKHLVLHFSGHRWGYYSGILSVPRHTRTFSYTNPFTFLHYTSIVPVSSIGQVLSPPSYFTGKKRIP